MSEVTVISKTKYEVVYNFQGETSEYDFGYNLPFIPKIGETVNYNDISYTVSNINHSFRDDGKGVLTHAVAIKTERGV